MRLLSIFKRISAKKKKKFQLKKNIFIFSVAFKLLPPYLQIENNGVVKGLAIWGGSVYWTIVVRAGPITQPVIAVCHFMLHAHCWVVQPRERNVITSTIISLFRDRIQKAAHKSLHHLFFRV
jgi:hypothetical protein